MPAMVAVRLHTLVSRQRSDVEGCASPSDRSARRIAQPIPSVLASDATQRCDSRASADRQMTTDATLDNRHHARAAPYPCPLPAFFGLAPPQSGAAAW